ncbi:MAG: glycosyltransferase [Candidatus Kapaibacterium sp.]|nr:MAG: glycosyltransferase [Candidatus Kapabacteria bacterium]
MQQNISSSSFHSSSKILGYACEWLENKQRTWSYVPYLLMKALEEEGRARNITVHDIDCGISQRAEMLQKLRHISISKHGIRSTYRQAVSYRRQIAQNFFSAMQSAPRLDALLQIGDTVPFRGGIPSYIYTDVSTECLVEFYREHGRQQHSYEAYSVRHLEKRSAYQKEIYATLTGAFTMSHWEKEYLRKQGIVPSGNIHTVHCAANLRIDDAQAQEWRKTKRDKFILFVGRDFFRKGGDLTVEAFTRFRKGYGEDVSLVVAGPETWPLSTPIPEGVRFVGAAPFQDLQRYFATADAFCMPSHFEAFGVVFAEALCAGVPPIGQRLYATPEIIQHGKNGYLLDKPDATMLAELMANVLDNTEMKKYVEDNVHEPREYYSWKRIANDMLKVLDQ